MRHAVLVVCLLLVACGSPGVAVTPTVTPVPVCTMADGRTAYAALKERFLEWSDAVELAASTPRIAVAPQVAKMQEIRRKAPPSTYPECAQKAASTLDLSMQGTIDGFIEFLGQKGDGDKQFTTASSMLSIFQDEMLKIRP